MNEDIHQKFLILTEGIKNWTPNEKGFNDNEDDYRGKEKRNILVENIAFRRY
jgi:hypothetical protein